MKHDRVNVITTYFTGCKPIRGGAPADIHCVVSQRAKKRDLDQTAETDGPVVPASASPVVSHVPDPCPSSKSHEDDGAKGKCLIGREIKK